MHRVALPLAARCAKTHTEQPQCRVWSETRTPPRTSWLDWWRRRSAGLHVPEKQGDPQVLKLVSVRDASPEPVGSIPKILTAARDPAAGERVEMAELYRRYHQDCAAEGSSAVSPKQFADPLKRFYKGVGGACIPVERPHWFCSSSGPPSCMMISD
jgi:hypothetical protein